jgi:holo-[acyl-carrier protein] synthase
MDMKGIGTDLCDISRIQKAMEKARFVERVFTPAERAFLESRGKGRVQSAAAMFAAKEAVVKALGTGFSGGIMPEMVEILHDDLGAPRVRLLDRAAQRMKAMGAQEIALSLSHERGLAMAVAVIE